MNQPIAAEPDLTLKEIRARLRAEKKLKSGTTSIWRFYERHDITFKKTLHAAEQDRPDVASARAELNPIGMTFSKLKTALRKGAALGAKALMKLIGKLVKAFAPEEYANYFPHAGYGH